MATHSSVLAWRIPGTAEPGGLPFMGSHRVGRMFSALAEPGMKVPLINLIPEAPDPRYLNRSPLELSMSYSPNTVE